MHLELTSKIPGSVSSLATVYHVNTVAGDDVAFALTPGGRYRMRFTNGAQSPVVLTVGLRVVPRRHPLAEAHRLLENGAPGSSGGKGDDGWANSLVSGPPPSSKTSDRQRPGLPKDGQAGGMNPSRGTSSGSEQGEVDVLVKQMEETAKQTSRLLQAVRNEALRTATRQSAHTKVVKQHHSSLDTSMAWYVAIAVLFAGLQIMLVRALAEEVRGDAAVIPFHRASKGAGPGSRTSQSSFFSGAALAGGISAVVGPLQWAVRGAASGLDVLCQVASWAISVCTCGLLCPLGVRRGRAVSSSGRQSGGLASSAHRISSGLTPHSAIRSADGASRVAVHMKPHMKPLYAGVQYGRRHQGAPRG